MAAVDRRGCDGCGRTLPIKDLAAVTLGGEEQAVCCPRCREHMESVVEESTPSDRPDAGLLGDCAGCGDTYAVASMRAVELPDGETIACCGECYEHAQSMSRRTDVDGHRGTCAGCEDDFDVTEMEAVTLEDGTTVACCAECAEYARAAATTTATETDDGESDSVAGRDAPSRAAGDSGARGVSENGTGALTGGAAGRSTPNRSRTEALALADSPSVCDQCGDWVDVELFEIVTLDDRIEEFCPPCTDRARAEGVVKEVRMRRAEAADALDVDTDAANDVVRDAYLSKIKRVHPDTPDGSKEAFRRVQRAYERLTDE